MVSALLRLVNRKFNTITQAAVLLGVFTFGSQILGLVRDRLLAGTFGPGSDLDVYYAAFKVPDILFAVAASLVSVTILIPFLVEKLSKDTEDRTKTRKFLNSIFTVFFSGMIVLALIAAICMPLLARWVAPGFTPDQITQLVLLGRIMLLSPILLGLSNLFGSITQSFRKFVVYALSPIFYNIGIVLGIIFLAPSTGIMGVTIGVVFGALLHFLVQWPVVIRERLLPSFSLDISWKEVREVFAISVPRTLTLAFSQIIFIVLVAIASTLQEGAISIFQFAFVLQSVPFAIIGVSYSVAAFPTLVAYATEGNKEKFSQAILLPARQILFWSLPVITLFIVLRAHIVRVILGTGNFDWTDTRLTAAALALFVFSVFAQGLIQLAVRAYYALGKTMRPLLINFFSAVLTIGFAFLFLHIYRENPEIALWLSEFLRVSDVSGVEILMLPLAYSAGILVNFAILWIPFAYKFLSKESGVLTRTSLEALCGSVVMGVTIFGLLRLLGPFFDLNVFWGVLGHGFLAGVGGIIMGGILMWYLGNEETKALVHAVRSKFWKANVVGE